MIAVIIDFGFLTYPLFEVDCSPRHLKEVNQQIDYEVEFNSKEFYSRVDFNG